MRASFASSCALVAIAVGATAACDVVNDFLTPPVIDDGARGDDDDDDDDVDCDDDRDCNGGEVCVDDVCVAICDSDRDCDGGEFCGDDGRCQAPACVDDDDCRGGFGCVDFACVPLGEGEGEEGEGEGEEGEGEEGEGEEGEGEEGEGEEGEGEGEEGEGEGEGDEAIRVQLSWSTNNDDVDVHLTRAAPPAFCTADDCSYRNKTTTWGARMDLDDINGFGPEQITGTALADGGHTILVDAYNVDASTTATLQVIAAGRVVFEDARLLRDGDHWLVARIDVDGGAASVTALDRLARQSGSCLGPAASTTATTCFDDADCAASEFCDADERCVAGCRNNSGCDAGETCSNGTCQAPAGSVAYGGTCTATSECVSGLTCGAFTGTCGESCSVEGDVCPRCEALTGVSCSCVSVLGLAFFCQQGS